MATILVVCTGNIRRSPAIAMLMGHGTPDVAGLAEHGTRLVSAGERACDDTGMDPLIRDALERAAGPLPDHVPQRLTETLIDDADLILTAERSHRSSVVGLVPAAVRRTFTLLELAALGARVGRGGIAGTDVDARLAELVRLAPRERAARLVPDPSVDDLADLRRPSPRAAAYLVAEVRAAVETLLRLLEPEPTLSLLHHSAPDRAHVDALVHGRTVPAGRPSA